jgi:hypothetical protein
MEILDNRCIDRVGLVLFILEILSYDKVQEAGNEEEELYIRASPHQWRLYLSRLILLPNAVREP